MVQKTWFKGDLGKDFFRRQRQENILPIIALTAMNPKHPEALKKSCHWYTGMMLRQHLPEGNIVDSDEIVLLGSGDTVFHSIVTRGNDQILSDDTSEDGACSVDLDAEFYYSEWYERTNPGMAKDIKVLCRMTIGDFKKHYMNQIIVEPETPGQG